MNTLPIAVIGGGAMGRRHAEILAAGDDVALAAFADPSPQVQGLAEKLGVPCFQDFAPMLDTVKPAGVVIATPNQFHVETSLACIARGIPLLLEKPVADTLAEARAIVAAADKADVPLLIGHHRRHHPIIRRAADLLREGVVGDVVSVHAMWVQRKPDDYFTTQWRTRAGGGPVLINAIHDIDCLRMLCGEIDTIQAATANATRKLTVEDTAAAIIRFKSGALGTLAVSDAANSPWLWDWGMRESDATGKAPENAYFIAGTRGSLAVPSLELWWRAPGLGWTDPINHERFSYVPAEAYAAQMKHFAAVIRGEEEPVVTGREGVATLAATLAIHESAKTGKLVRLDEFSAQA